MSKETLSLLHRAVQQAVWKKQWDEFKPIQVDSIHAICESNRNLLICARTAGGKTEAAFLPIISELVGRPMPSVQALYIGPLKALINDQFQRLEGLCSNLDIAVHRWHGDVSAGAKKKLRDNPNGILLITPESLESNFINFGTQVPGVYRHLAFVVIDELHCFISGVRGIHLQSLLSRLRAVTGCSPRIVALSATIANPQLARAFIAPDDVDSVEVIADASERPEVRIGVRAYLCPPDREELTGDVNKPDELDDIAEDILNRFSDSTNLIYGNQKATLEDLADKLHQRIKNEKRATDPFVVHHGSLSKDLREEVETKLKSGVPTTALCTSTLELGIDIGNVKAIGQIDPPFSVASMVQRLGRSGRREGEPSRMRIYVRENSPNQRSSQTDLLYPSLLRSIAMVRLMCDGWLEPFETNRPHYSTLIHQILSFLKQTGGMNAAHLFSALCRAGPFRAVTESQFAALLRGLASHELIDQIEADLILGLEGEKLTASFDFYAAFDTKIEFTIHNGKQEIGSLPASRVPPVNEHLILAGKRWRVTEIVEVQKRVFVVPAPGRRIPSFVDASHGDIHSRIVSEMKAVLMAADEPAFLDPASKVLLRAARKTAHCSGLDKSDVHLAANHVEWLPWVGTRTLDTLLLVAQLSRIRTERDRHKLSIRYLVQSPGEFYDHLQQTVAAPPDAVALAKLIERKAVDKFDDFVPEPLLDHANAVRQLDLPGALEACQTALKCKANAS